MKAHRVPIFTMFLSITGSTLVLQGASPAAPLRGDVDSNGQLNITDPIAILGFLFLGTKAPPCNPVADANSDRVVNLTDAVVLLNFLFLGSPAPSPLSAEEISICAMMIPDSESSFWRPGHSLYDALRWST